jgi:hypothetical protein
MPEIKRYTRQVQATGLQRTGDTRGAFGGQMGEDLQEAGQQLEQYATKRAKSDYIATMSAFKLDNMRVQEELSKQDFGPDADLSQIYQQNLEERASQLNISPLVGDLWERDFAQMRVGFAQDGMSEGVRREGIATKENWENTLTNVKNAVALGGSREGAMQMVSAAAEALPSMSQEERSVFLNSAQDSVINAEATRVLSSNPFEFKRLANEGYFNDLPNLQRFVVSADTDIARQRKAAEAQQFAVARLQGGLLDPKDTGDKKILDNHYNSIPLGDGNISAAITNMDEAGSQMAHAFANKYKIVPDGMQQTLRGMMNGGDLEQKEYAYKLVSDIEDTGAVGFTDSEKADAKTYDGLVSAGVNPKQAVETIALFGTPDFQKTKDAHKQMLSTGDNGKPIKIGAASRLDSAFSWWFSSPEHIAATANYDYNTIWNSEYLKTGNEEASHTVATKIVKSKYKETEVLGYRGVLAYPPEDFGLVDLSEKENRKFMREELREQLSASGNHTNLSDYTLYSLPENENYVKQGINPRYYMIDKETNGYAVDEQNQAILFSFDNKKASEHLKAKRKEEEGTFNDRLSRQRAERAVMADPTRSVLDKALIKAQNNARDVMDVFGLKEGESKPPTPPKPFFEGPPIPPIPEKPLKVGKLKRKDKKIREETQRNTTEKEIERDVVEEAVKALPSSPKPYIKRNMAKVLPVVKDVLNSGVPKSKIESAYKKYFKTLEADGDLSSINGLIDILLALKGGD